VTWSTILVGTDGSPTAARAVSHAAELAAATSAALVVVTAYADRAGSPPASEPVPTEMQWTLTASAGAEELARGAAELAGQAGARNVRVRTGRGDPAAVLLRVASELGADLIVVGSKGMTSPTRFVTGSVPNTLSHHADRDVLIVRTD